ncbi:MAG: hypothetical protein IJ247_00785 [Bacilli bacterium]|nr:hypothetical protein [Bacilli bacterium]
MTNFYKKSLLFVLPLLFSCGGNPNPSNNSNESDSSKTTFYLDEPKTTLSDFEVDIGNVYSSNLMSENYRFSVSLKLKNISTEKQRLSIDSPKLINEDANTEYTVSYLFFDKDVDSLITETVSFESRIPTSSEEERYMFSVSINKLEYSVHLYETPDELREDIPVTYMIDEEEVYKTSVKRGRQIGDLYVYENPNHIYYCDTWKDVDGTEVTNTKVINEEIVLYGSDKSALKTKYEPGDGSLWVQGVNHVYSDGVIYVDNSPNGPVYISNYAITDPAITKIYFPKKLKRIYIGNFDKCTNLDAIYFEGSESEWNSIENSSTIPSKTKIVFGTSFEQH